MVQLKWEHWNSDPVSWHQKIIYVVAYWETYSILKSVKLCSNSSYAWIVDHINPQNPPWGIEGIIVFSLCPFPDESAGVYQIWCQLVHPFGSYSRFVNFWPPKTPQNAPWGIEGLIVFSLCPFPDESAGVYQMLCQLVHPFGSYSRFVNFWPPKTPQTPLG